MSSKTSKENIDYLLKSKKSPIKSPKNNSVQQNTIKQRPSHLEFNMPIKELDIENQRKNININIYLYIMFYI